jgi:DNA-binding NarL/FixJ family response regulator
MNLAIAGPERRNGTSALSAPTTIDPADLARILLVDDHPVVRRGMSSLLSHQPHLRVVAEASDGVEALRKARELLPDLILMDVDMPHMNGLAATEALRKEHPDIKVLILSMLGNSEYVLRIIESGAKGYVLKESSPEEVLRAVDTVLSGKAYFSPEVARVAMEKFVRGRDEPTAAAQLTHREREVLTQIAEGLSNKEVANLLGMGVRTVETHRERIMNKLGIRSVAGLTKFALQEGLITLNLGARG